VLRRVSAPIYFDTLIDVIASLIHLEQRRIDVPIDPSLPAEGASLETDLELRTSLRELWRDIQQLAPRQRAALLLNLRDKHGREIVSLLPRTRTATIAEIADAVQIPLGDFGELWRKLPLSDAEIGKRIGASPQQVIKLRRLARERLRRLANRREESLRKSRGQKIASASHSSSSRLSVKA
jgi:CRP-like cAMP-binding protein